MKRFLAALLLVFGLFTFAGCDIPAAEKSADSVQRQQTEQAMSEAQRQVGMPNIVNFQQRKLLKMIYELTDKEDLVCYAYIKSDYQGKLIFIGKCIGYGLPYSAQFTNPEKIVEADKAMGKDVPDYHFEKLQQPEPNGIFMPGSSQATWLMMIDPETNKPRAVYIESELTVSPFKLAQ